MKSRWPSRLWIVRHGESAGNVARDLAHASGLGRIDIAQHWMKEHPYAGKGLNE